MSRAPRAEAAWFRTAAADWLTTQFQSTPENVPISVIVLATKPGSDTFGIKLMREQVLSPFREAFLQAFPGQLRAALEHRLKVSLRVKVFCNFMGTTRSFSRTLFAEAPVAPVTACPAEVLCSTLTEVQCADSDLLTRIRDRLYDPLVLAFHARVSDDFIRQKALHEGLQVLRKTLEV